MFKLWESLAENGGLEPQAFYSSLCFQNSDARPNASLSKVFLEFSIYVFHQIVEYRRGKFHLFS